MPSMGGKKLVEPYYLALHVTESSFLSLTILIFGKTSEGCGDARAVCFYHGFSM
jgi:hypothetical protein